MLTNGSGDLTLSGALSVGGNTTLGNADGDQTTMYGTTPLVFEGTTASSFTTSIAVSGATQNNTITLPDASGTFLINAGSGLTASAAGTVSLGATNNTDGSITSARNVNIDNTTLTFQDTDGNDIMAVGSTTSDGEVTIDATANFTKAVKVAVRVNNANALVMNTTDYIVIQTAASDITLPDGSDGRLIIIKNLTVGDRTITAFDNTDAISGGVAGPPATITIGAGVSMKLVFSGGTWYQVGN
jgi:hypothetical protein